MTAIVAAEPISKHELSSATWKLINAHFKEDKGYQLVKHLLDSYNDFVLNKIDNIIDGFNPIEVYHQFMPELQKFKYAIHIEIKNPILSKPIIYEKDGSTKIMTPTDARNRNFTYAAPLYIDLHITTRMWDDQKQEYDTEMKKINNVCLGKIPVMVGSRYCVLSTTRVDVDECRYGYGGYFIINGNEKVVICQDRIAENVTYVFVNNKVSTYSHIAEIRSVTENKFSVPKTTSLKLSAKANQFGRYIRANIHHVKQDIPVFILFRALGIESDHRILEYCIPRSDPHYEVLAAELIGSIEEGNTVMYTRDAREYLCRYMNINGHPKELMYNKQYKMNVMTSVLEKEFLPHAGPNFGAKAMYLGYMVNKLLKCYMGVLPFDDRDSYINKRIDTPGILMANLFRQYYGKVVKDMKNMIQKDINSGAWKATNKFSNVITKVNINKIVKSTIIESGLKFGLATGNWGIKSAKTKQGVAQVLNRMSYNATISHLRRINTPIEKTGKLIQPRKLHSTQWGIICPTETPEGVSVGLVKNLAVSSTVSIGANSCNLRERIADADEFDGVTLFTGDNIEIFDNTSTKIIINGDIIGVTNAPNTLYAKVKMLKRLGIINVCTSVFWNIPRSEISICTEAGRCIRPLYVVNEETNMLSEDIGKLGWKDLVTRGAIEYLDVQEINSAMIAMKYADLTKGFKGFQYPVKYTHMEIDPSLILGVLAGSIPFSDHNQAPRNAYQCLKDDTLVLMGDGTRKMIKDVQVGEEVVTFNPDSKEHSITKVVHQYVKPTDKKIFKITTTSGRSIVATYDHKFMTNQGWQEVQHFNADTLLGISDMSDKLDITSSFKSTVSQIKTTYVPIQSVEEVPNCLIADITVENDTNQSFIAGDNFMVHNSAMCKQAIGVYTSTYRKRFDTLGHVLYYPQKPIVYTRVGDLINHDKLPSGMNVIVAIATYTGYNQEDSVILNKSSVDRGMFMSTYYRTYKDQNSKNHSTGEEEYYCKPDMENTKNLKPYNYNKLTMDGFVPESTYIESGDVIIGKCMPQRQGATILNKDSSVALKNNETGYIDKNSYGDNIFTNVNGDGYTFSKVRVRSERVPTIGDKFASRSAQKGTCGMMYNQEDMPFTSTGIVPDIILNPHAIPSRMTIAQLMECIMGKACASLGTFGDASPFTDLTVEDIAKALDKVGLERYGNEIMYNSRTGEMQNTEIFIGPTYYQRLKHMVADKTHCMTGDHEVLTTYGWVRMDKLTMNHTVATMVDGKLVYQKPSEVQKFNFSGKLYDVQSNQANFTITPNHRMFVGNRDKENWRMELAENMYRKRYSCKKNVDEWVPDFTDAPKELIIENGVVTKIQLDGYTFRGVTYPDFVADINDWLIFFGIWIAEGCASWNHGVRFATNKQRVKAALEEVCENMNLTIRKNVDKPEDNDTHSWGIYDRALMQYMIPFSVGATKKYLPLWTWYLSREQCRTLIKGMCLGDGHINKSCKDEEWRYGTSSTSLADDFQRLCLHAGYSANKCLKQEKGSSHIGLNGTPITLTENAWQLSVIRKQNEPLINKNLKQSDQSGAVDNWVDYKGKVYCCTVPQGDGIIYIRKNGIPIWTGNSRASNGPIVALTRQPAEGRARDGGLRLGEMEVECNWAHGTMQFLKERFMDASDNYRVFICKKCGMMANVNPESKIYECKPCNNHACFSQIRIPYACKLLFQEVQTMGIGAKFLT